MKISRNLWIFCIINLISSIIFFTYLGNAVSGPDASSTTQNWTLALIAPLVYGFTWFLSALILGYNDKVRQSRSNIGIMYHLACIVVLSVSIIYAAILFKDLRTWQFIVLPILFNGISFLIHWLATRRYIKGISKSDAFK